MARSKSGISLPASVTAFANSAQNLSRSPLGIIALFIVLIYGMACIVIIFGASKLTAYQERLPLVWFLALFPCMVLGVFTWLVAYHHTKLYAPRDFTDETTFRELANPPKQIANSTEVGVAVTEEQMPDHFIAANEPILKDDLDHHYNELNQGYWLVHAAEVLQPRTRPRSGRYRVRVWVEGWTDEELLRIKRVTYRLWDDFHPNQIATTNAASNFDVWLNIYGEFPILARVELNNGNVLRVSRYLDLPGRPPD